MSNNEDTQRSEADAELEREIRKGRKFTLAEAIGRLAGPGAMKGESPIARMQQAQIEIESWLRSHLADAGEHYKSCWTVTLRGANSCSTTLINRWSSWPATANEFSTRTTFWKNSFAMPTSNGDALWMSGPTSRKRALRTTPTTPTRSSPSATL